VLWTEIPVHVIDFEGSRETGIVEFGVVTLLGGAITGVATRLCRARGRVSADDTRVHGLREADLAAAAPFEQEWEHFAALRAGGVLAAHFSGTENALLRAVWPCPRLSPDFLHGGGAIAEWGPWIDTGRIATEVLPRGSSAALGDVVSALGLVDALEQAGARWCPQARRSFHCAPYDAIASALVLQRLACERDGTPWSLARAIAVSTGDRDRRDDLMQGRLF
jgi:DNA polymerase-3 subunit epsilon